ncbi:histone-lysine N-methyltransferase, H3 lysine-9 specific SUVH1-like [Punica granatum]|uniref:Histone-lysine N-methyltransferase, H3 lysine-9 specific SUVH1-like n=1 Tax=Punica granatum TaxID=22663 RepID=A0A218X025_PUNGR|nr:histone-lysine N-methyltransferase, H3 lysine-9 specific SUVH1-like [Punica granatum]XP_031377653.1 histone-lysine N-methyltransferase, H3 lysine-9 specific SUVH1-like [Punica granatum]XP_031377654.1 histone-lysine N-methyltransferase, H3 lysine-9 specific SUVH1-like [Punica granatum]XP_031377655.1 histone-lysine N-methyltransferase, H3 lysine-9 specific SUVH1-like [Punica granatum]OWM78505.1 hypothetical protein CDL15_Pgr016229 [Punica granatum]
MQGSSGHNAVPPSTSADTSRILDVKPLRSLKPIFPPSNQAAPFVCGSPNGPFPPEYSSFYPFCVPPPPPEPEPPQPQATWTAAAPTPIRSFRTPGPSDGPGEMMNGDAEQFAEGKKRASGMRPSSSSRRRRSTAMVLGRSAPGTFVIPISPFNREVGNREMVDYVLTTFDALRRRLSQLEDAKEAPGGIIRRADLKASSILMTQNVRTNMKKRVGVVPGVEIGDIFFFRMEMCLVGLHTQSMGGIDYMTVRGEQEEESVALSIVSSGYYDDDAEDKDVLIYSGQGGAMTRNGKPAPDQQLVRGNLALDRSMHRANEVRVIRGMPDSVNPNTKVYMYDGLYIIQQSWMEKAKSGANTFKYKLVRVPGQPDAFAIWKTIQRWKEDISTRSGVIIADLTSGGETIAVSLVNDVDNEKGPPYFNYFSTLKYSRPFSILHSSYECNCHNACKPGDLNCSCVRKNGGDFPYTANGVLVSRKPLVYECGPSCPCGPNCKNRVSQGGPKVRLEVFKTKNRGWGLRSCDPIRAGSFICEYAGEVIDKDRLKQKVDEGENDEYIFDTSRVYEPFKWNYEVGLLEDESTSDSPEEYNIPSPLIISAKEFGNVGRFMNHSCYPTVFWQPVTYGTSNESYLHIAFYAMRHIPPMTELTYDYGMVPTEGGIGAAYRKRKCLCGSPKCRGHFGL